MGLGTGGGAAALALRHVALADGAVGGSRGSTVAVVPVAACAAAVAQALLPLSEGAADVGDDSDSSDEDEWVGDLDGADEDVVFGYDAADKQGASSSASASARGTSASIGGLAWTWADGAAVHACHVAPCQPAAPAAILG